MYEIVFNYKEDFIRVKKVYLFCIILDEEEFIYVINIFKSSGNKYVEELLIKILEGK